MIDRDQIVQVALELKMPHPSDEKIKYVLDYIESESVEDPSGNVVLWIERLLYEYAALFEEKLYTFKYYKDGELKHTDVNQKSDICVFKYMHKAQSQSIDWATKHGGWKIECINQTTNQLIKY
jgi:hypothetical protein